MPLYELSVSKRLTVGSDFKRWTNTYHADVPDLGSALAVAEAISIVEQKIHKDYVLFSYASAREAIENPPPGGIIALTGTGDIVGDPTIRLPNFNAVRVILADGNGRPSQKYLRLPLEEGEVTDGTLTAALINDVFLEYVTDLMAIPEIRSNSGNEFTSGSVHPAVQMRQQNWNRRTRAGFHRGWVPNP